jgi:GT2 family glycosyltransferase
LNKRVGIVVPTLGERPDYLNKCLSSISQAGLMEGRAHIILVCPKSFDFEPLLQAGKVHQIVKDPGAGLPEAINEGFRHMPLGVEFINWLGDDDLLAPSSLDVATQVLDAHPDSVMAFGGCEYIDPKGEVIWTNRSGKWAVPLLRVGPDLIPQPGALFLRESFLKVGGLDARFNWAFDFDLFIKLSKIGKIEFIPQPLASFRWHPESLSVEFRKKSVREAHQVRISQLPFWVRPFAFIWEYPVKLTTYLAGMRITRLAAKLDSSAG